MKPKAIGVVEINFFTNAVVVLDVIMKASGVSLATCFKTLGGRMIHLVVEGSTSQVEQAMEEAHNWADENCPNDLKVAVAISNPHSEICRILGLPH